MKVLLVMPWDQAYGGVASVVGYLGTYLNKQNHDILFVSQGKSYLYKSSLSKWKFKSIYLYFKTPFALSFTLKQFFSFLFVFPVTLLQLIWIIKINRIEIVNVHYALGGFFYFAICRRLLSIRLVTSIHGADLFPKGAPRDKYEFGLKSLIKNSDHIVAPSRSLLNDFLKIYPTLKNRSSFIHNGIDIDEFKLTRKKVSNREYILCIAQHNHKKAIDILLDAFEKIQDNHEELVLYLVGDGPLRKQLEEKATSKKLRVEFLGEKNRKNIVDLLHGCKIFVLPSRAEPFGIVIVEAMACRKPVIASCVGGIPEIITHRINGMLVQPDNAKQLAEALTEILSQPNLAEKLAISGFQTVQSQFTYQRTGMSYLELFQTLMSLENRRKKPK